MSAARLPRWKRDAVFERDNRMCACCGSYQNLTIQHRANRGMGGSKLRDGFMNLLTLCWSCNTQLEQDAEFAEFGREHGFKLQSWENPLTVSVKYRWAGEWRYLDSAGETIPADGRVKVAHVHCTRVFLEGQCDFEGDVELLGTGVWECPSCGWDTPW